MRDYSAKITFSRNSRGVYSIDPSIGCASGMDCSKGGCYGDCYAARTAKIYGYDFAKTVLRYFESEQHLQLIKQQIRKIEMPFIRMGTNGDPSENWAHTLDICEKLQTEKQLELFHVEPKEIVIITKHWQNLTSEQIDRIARLKICVNTSVSAMDNPDLLNNSLAQYELLKPVCRSVLRVVTCDFNTCNSEGKRLKSIQDSILDGRAYIDTVFRPSKNNKLVLDNVINVYHKKFLKGKQLASKLHKTAYMSRCETCPDMCGLKTTVHRLTKQALAD